MDAGQNVSRMIKLPPIKLANLPALGLRVEYASDKVPRVVEQVVALRCGIIYTIGLQTLQMNSSFDEKQFQQVLDGFRVLKLSKSECPTGL